MPVGDLWFWLQGGDLAAAAACAGIAAIVAYSRWVVRWWRARSRQPIDAAAGPQQVASVADGDSLRLVGIERAVRLIGADAPESTAVRFGEPECWGAQATAYLEDLVDGHNVRVELGTDPLDRYDRLLAYVWVDDQLVNETLIRSGLAYHVPYRPNTRFARRFDAAERAAHSERLGIWSGCRARIDQ